MFIIQTFNLKGWLPHGLTAPFYFSAHERTVKVLLLVFIPNILCAHPALPTSK